MKKGSFTALLASVSAASLLVGAMSTASAQEVGASLTGDVRRADGARGFAGVDVTIRELGITAETGTDGRFRFPNVAPGAYTLELSYLGEVIDTRQVTIGAEALSLSFSLSDETLAETVVVTGTRGALASARAQERSRDNLTSVVTADDIGNFADQNIAESLQRIPGASIRRSEGEGRTPAIRGLSEGFVTVTIDGTRLGGRTEDDAGDTRAVSLDVFSSDLLNGIEVTKTSLPDQDADSIGGAINLRSLSAFDRGSNSFAARAEYGLQENTEDWNPKASLDFTRLFDLGGSGRIGLAGGLSWQRRNSLVDTIGVDNGLRSTVNGTAGEIIRIYDNANTAPGPNPAIWTTASTAWTDPGNCATVLQTYCILAADGIYTPLAVDYRADPAERERLSANFNLQWRPNALDEFFVRGTFARFTDDDVRNRQSFGLDPALHEEIIELGPNLGVFADADVERRFRFSHQEDNLFTIALGGEHARGPWTFDYQLDISRNESDIPSAEARFRERDVILRYADLGINGVTIEQYPDLDGTNADPSNPQRFDLRFVTAYDFFTLDEITTGRFDVQRDFNPANRPGFIRFGVKRSEREREVDVTRFRSNSPVPGITLADFPLIPGGQLNGSNIQFLFAPEIGAIEAFAWDLRENGVRDSSILNPGDEVISFARDYTASEVVTAAYAMLNLELAERWTFTGGVRIEDTEWTSDGFIANRITYDEGAGEASITIRDNLLAAGVTPAQILASSLGARYSFNGVTLTPVSENAFGTPSSGENSYTDMFFNLNLRWEPVDDLVVRASFTQGIQRPNFDEASANGEFLVDETTDVLSLAGLTTIAQIEQVVSFRGQAGTSGEPLRDPSLDPLRSNNYDLSLSWYPNSDTYFQIALFRKDITDFIVRIVSNDATSFGFDPTEFDTVNTYVNGEDAWIQGVELSYAQNYTFLPGILGGLFFAGNVTLAESEQTDGVSGRSLTFQDQADLVGNASFGWENDVFSLRVSGNYVGERLTALNAGALGLQFAASDEYEQERFSVDVNARYSVNERFQIYVDAININEAEDRRFFRGGGVTGPVFSGVETYGATYQVGVRARF